MNNQKKKILIVEDDPTFSLLLKAWCQKNDYEPVAVFTVEAAQQEVLKQPFDLILTDLRLPDSDGIMFLTWLKDRKNEIPVIMLTSYADIQTAVAAMKLGAFDFMEKPINHLIMKEKMEAAMSSMRYAVRGERCAIVGAQNFAPINKDILRKNDTIIGNSPAAKEMYAHIQLVAPTDLSVLIFGESGTGKEHVAKFIHEQSKRSKAPFIAVDCGVLSKELAASELFGHVKGAFTSAISDKTGVFEEATGGTLFFDEIGNLPHEVQAQLLRALQERKIRKVGSAKEIAVDVRLLCATNEDLTKAIQEGRFREDLFHRLQEFIIEAPALRNRLEDIELFSHFFREQANLEVSKEVNFISPEALAILKQHHWKGNLRELKNTIRRAVLFAPENIIFPDHLPVFQKETIPSTFALFDEKVEKHRILNALQKSSGNKTIAAKMLNIDRKTLYNKMHAYHIDLG
ncbi:MAG: sigma-54 dependent transcriptional regulator [Bacteroidetes bacterium]|nr:sigma-54 dependent transcriptional regulator [Bacteroidota bacterium]MCL2301715.1 sigma-54 dependent transcriptional regulator [Lentimicrobiaceae bacterium]